MKKVIFNNQEVRVGKVVCVGRNYVEHIKELGNEFPPLMVLFNKPASSISKELIKPSESCRFEGEICFLMDKTKVKGVGFGIDLTLDEVQNELKKAKLPWERAKAFKNSATFSHFIPFNGDINSISMKLFINGNLIQFGNVELMIYKPNEIIKQIDEVFGLNDGDIIMSGTPKGVGYFEKGDIFEAKIYENEKLILEYKWIVK